MTNHSPARESIYSASQSRSNYPDGIQHLYWNRGRNLFLEWLYRRIVRGQGRILEIGCNRGVVLEHFRLRGYDAWGCDLSDVSPFPAVSEFVFPRTGFADLPMEFRKTVENLFILDVLEHLPEPEPFLAEVLQAFPRLQRLLLTVPAHSELWSNYDDHFGHLRRYSLEDLQAMSRKMNWPDYTIGYFFHALYPPMRLHSLLGRTRDVHLSGPGGVARFIHAVAGWLLFTESWMLPRNLPGSSLYAAFHFSCEKPGSLMAKTLKSLRSQ